MNTTLLMSAAILTETALSYVGLGVQAPDTSLGKLISDNQAAFSTRPWLFWCPGLFIVVICLTINFIGDGLRDAFDPRQKKLALRRVKETDRSHGGRGSDWSPESEGALGRPIPVTGAMSGGLVEPLDARVTRADEPGLYDNDRDDEGRPRG